MCKTNIPSNTAFRGFGGPQGMMVMEHIMSEIAVKLNISAEQVDLYLGTYSLHVCIYLGMSSNI